MNFERCDCCGRDYAAYLVRRTSRDGVRYCDLCWDSGCNPGRECEVMFGTAMKRRLRTPQQCRAYGHVLDADGYCRTCGLPVKKRIPQHVQDRMADPERPTDAEIEAAIASIRTSVPDAPPAKS